MRICDLRSMYIYMKPDQIKTVVFISNFFNHHQLPFCLEMDRLTEHQFYFIATKPVPQDRLQLGYSDMNEAYPFVLRAYENDSSDDTARKLCDTCDVLIYGSCPKRYYIPRLRRKKLTFRYAERFFKTPFNIKNALTRFGAMLIKTIPYQNNRHFLLCASAYTSSDAAIFGCYKNRAFRWGYFPEVNAYTLPDLFAKKQPLSILWVGRMIDWKHPELPIRLAKQLKAEGFAFHLTMVGTGPMEQELKQSAVDAGLSDCLTFTGPISPAQVRAHMEQSGIFLFTSDRNEGWGAVLNESMNSGCAVVAGNAIGSVPFLMQNAQNGLIYEDGNYEMLYEQVKTLLQNPQLQRRLGENAYNTLANHWNAKTAAQRLLQLVDAIQAGTDPNTVFPSGICSTAIIEKAPK